MSTPSSALDDLPDETPPSIGEEISSAMAPVVQEIQQSGEKNVRLLGTILDNSINAAIKAIENRELIVEKKRIKEIKHKVHRDSKGNILDVVSTPEYEDL